MFRLFVFIVFFSCTICSCSKQPKVMPVNTMVPVLWDLQTADEWHKIALSKDSSLAKSKQNISLYNKIFAFHKINKEEFYKSYNYYTQHPIELKVLMDSLVSYGTKKRDTVANHIIPSTIKKQ